MVSVSNYRGCYDFDAGSDYWDFETAPETATDCIRRCSAKVIHFLHLTLKLPGPSAGVGGSLTVTIA